MPGARFYIWGANIESPAGGSIVVLAQQPFQTRAEAAFDFGFDVRGEVVDHVLHDQVRGGTQFAVQVQQVVWVLAGGGCRRGGSGGWSRFYGRLRRADRVEQHRNLFLVSVLDRVGQQRWLQVVIAEQLADRLEVVQQVRGLLQRFWSVHRNAQSRCKR